MSPSGSQPLPDHNPPAFLTISFWNGGSVVAVAAAGLIISLLFQMWSGVLVGFLIASAGVMELWGRKLAIARKPAARFWMPFSQLWLLAMLLAYCVWSMNHSELQRLIARFIPVSEELGFDQDAMETMIHQMIVVGYASVILVSVMYQGGLAWYYARGTRAMCPPATPRS